MKISHSIIILIVLGLALFVAKDDVKSLYHKASMYFSENFDAQKIGKNLMIETEKLVNAAKSINTPGALKATTGLASNAANVKLSVSGTIAVTNAARAQNGGLPALHENSKLDFSAQKKLDDMLRGQYFEHMSPEGKGVADLAESVSYEYIVIGENLALGNFKDNQALVDAWMASPGHRANILNNRYAEIGVAVGHGMYQGVDTWLAVQHFGLPRSACPPIDENLHGAVILEENNLKEREADLAKRKEQIDSGAVYDGKTTNEQIDEYNAKVAEYNDILVDLKAKLAAYNDQVRAFNACLEKNT